MSIAERLKAGWVAIFKPGTRKAMDGRTYTFSDQDVAAIAAVYSPTLHQSPAVIGHPEVDAPAYGWADGLEFADGVLWAKLKDVYPRFSSWVKQGWYRNISASFYPPETSPVAGQWYLKHIGFLGAAPPAVAGLPHTAFAADRASVAFDDPMPLLDELAVNEQLDTLDELTQLFWDQLCQIRYAPDIANKKEVILAKVNDLASAIGSLDFTDKEDVMEPKTFKQWLREGLEEMGLVKPSAAPASGPQFTEAQVQERETAAVARARTEADTAAARTLRAATVHAEIAAFVDAGVAAGTFLPAWKEAGVPQVIEQRRVVRDDAAGLLLLAPGLDVAPQLVIGPGHAVQVKPVLGLDREGLLDEPQGLL